MFKHPFLVQKRGGKFFSGRVGKHELGVGNYRQSGRNIIFIFCSNNNDNNNIQDSGTVQGTSQDTDLMSTSMTMVITIVPPVGPPVPVLVGRAIQKAPNASFEIFLNEELEKDGVYFEAQESNTKLFPNGTIIYANGTNPQLQQYHL